ncbi:MAG: peptidase Ste24p [Hyphomicrobiales bacterium]|nr:peptidase Ste24p [Hyphomicrobiales bacterium]
MKWAAALSHQLTRIRLATALPLALVLSGCAALDPGGRKAELPAVPTAAPRTTGVETPTASEHKRLVALFGGEFRSAAAELYLNGILARLAQTAETPTEAYRVTILNTPLVNAFALPSGNLYVTRGLLALANDSSEIAAVMAHEISHVTARHASQRAELERNAAVISKAASLIQSRQKGEEVQASGRMSLASFSRQQELEADQIGVKTIARAGYDPYGAARFLTSLGRASTLRASLFGQKAGEDQPDILATHPSTPERVRQATAAARQLGAPGIGLSAREEYFNAIDGVDFGDDPSEGFVRGRRFVHPKLGFTFSAPDGFVLENSAQALLGIAAGGTQALRLDSVSLSSSTPLETYIASGWMDGLDPNSIRAANLNGIPAALASARGGEWHFRVAVMRFGDSVYRLIFATRSLTPAMDARFMESIESFRSLGAEATQRSRPLRLKIVTASASDTPATLARRMSVPEQQLEQFLLLNGLESGAALRPEERYKIVVE